jgi:hypothetical protein
LQVTGRTSQRFLVLYVLWTILCAALFLALANREDPSRPHGRILNNDAANLALAALRTTAADGARFEVVHVAYEDHKWIVLCDRVPHTALREAVVVELRASDGALLRIRKPVR